MAANNIGALAVVEQHGDDEIIGVFSERDYLHKIAVLNKDPSKIKIREVATIGTARLVIVDQKDSIEECMQKMLGRGIRHLLVRRDQVIAGMISVKDVVECARTKEIAVINRLEGTVQSNICVATPY
jgi:CBS domain-containing protein